MANPKVHYCNERPPERVQSYRRFVTCEGKARSYTASAVEVPMRPSSAIFSLFMVSTVSERVSLGGDEPFSTMLVSSEFVVSAASENYQRVFLTKTFNQVQMMTRLTRLRLLGWGAVKANGEADHHKNNLLEDAHAEIDGGVGLKKVEPRDTRVITQTAVNGAYDEQWRTGVD